MAALQIVGAVAGLAGTFIQAAGEREAGDAAYEDAQIEAAQLERQGKEEFASSQREAILAKREARLAASRGQAVAAASGAGAGVEAPTVVHLMEGIAKQGAMNADAALFGGESRRAGAFDTAAATRRTGRARRDGAYRSALGTVVGGFGRAANSFSDSASKVFGQGRTA